MMELDKGKERYNFQNTINIYMRINKNQRKGTNIKTHKLQKSYKKISKVSTRVHKGVWGERYISTQITVVSDIWVIDICLQ